MSDAILETTNAETMQFAFSRRRVARDMPLSSADGSWGEGPGSMTASKSLGWPLLFGEMFSRDPDRGTIIKGFGLRAFNPRTSEWEHTWTETSAPGAFWSGAGDLKVAPSIFTASGPGSLATHLVSGH